MRIDWLLKPAREPPRLLGLAVLRAVAQVPVQSAFELPVAGLAVTNAAVAAATASTANDQNVLRTARNLQISKLFPRSPEVYDGFRRARGDGPSPARAIPQVRPIRTAPVLPVTVQQRRLQPDVNLRGLLAYDRDIQRAGVQPLLRDLGLHADRLCPLAQLRIEVAGEELRGRITRGDSRAGCEQ